MNVQQRKFWMDETDFKNLQNKAKKHFTGKGFLSAYLRMIADPKNSLLIVSNAEKVNLVISKEEKE